MLIAYGLIAMTIALALETTIRIACKGERAVFEALTAIAYLVATEWLLATEPPETEPLGWAIAGAMQMALAALTWARAWKMLLPTLEEQLEREEGLARVKARIGRLRDSEATDARQH